MHIFLKVEDFEGGSSYTQGHVILRLSELGEMQFLDNDTWCIQICTVHRYTVVILLKEVKAP